MTIPLIEGLTHPMTGEKLYCGSIGVQDDGIEEHYLPPPTRPTRQYYRASSDPRDDDLVECERTDQEFAEVMARYEAEKSSWEKCGGVYRVQMRSVMMWAEFVTESGATAVGLQYGGGDWVLVEYRDADVPRNIAKITIDSLVEYHGRRR